LPISRANYLFAKFISISFFLIACAIVLGLVSAVVVMITTNQYPSDTPVSWSLFFLALAADTIKFMLLVSVSILLSAVSTSFFLPFFGTIAIYLSGNASQEVFEYISGQYGQNLSPFVLSAIKGIYYLIPNFSAFNFKVQAVYALDVPISSILYPLAYSLLYIGVILVLSAWVFNRRELP